LDPNLVIPPDYRAILNPRETEEAIREIKDFFQTNLAFELNLARVTAPLFVRAGTGINDDLNGVEQPAAFNVKELRGDEVQLVQSLAKWKRMALADLGLAPGEGLYTDMNAVRPDDAMDSTHSIYVDQWDWERVIDRGDRSVAFLKDIVCRIYDVIRRTEKFVAYRHHDIHPDLPDTIRFFHSQELADAYPDLHPRERETRACREHGAVFVIGIGAPLSNGEKHDGRAPDYDDWSTPAEDGRPGLNGDILVWNPVLESAFELSSMGIRVDREALLRQLEITGTQERKELLFHRKLLDGELPLSIGGGIGQSRLCMLYLRKAHVGEIQASVWPETMVETCRKAGIHLL
jgi:aspartate--ammonia ligase